MKIFKLQKPPKPPETVRVYIHQQGKNRERFAICEATLEECVSHIERIVAPHQGVKTEIKTTIELRLGRGKFNGESKSISGVSINSEETRKLIVDSIDQLWGKALGEEETNTKTHER